MGPAQLGLPPPATQSGPPESYAPLPVLAFGASSMTACVLMLRVQRGPKNGRKFTRLIRIWKNERKKGSPKLAPRSLAYNERGPDTCFPSRWRLRPIPRGGSSVTPLKLRVRGTAPHPTPTGLRGALRGLGAAVRALCLCGLCGHSSVRPGDTRPPSGARAVSWSLDDRGRAVRGQKRPAGLFPAALRAPRSNLLTPSADLGSACPASHG